MSKERWRCIHHWLDGKPVTQRLRGLHIGNGHQAHWKSRGRLGHNSRRRRTVCRNSQGTF